jgi:hypothetical protein
MKTKELVYKSKKTGQWVTDTKILAEHLCMTHTEVLGVLNEALRESGKESILNSLTMGRQLTWEQYKAWLKWMTEHTSLNADSPHVQEIKWQFWEKKHQDEQKVAGVAKVIKPDEVGGSHYNMAIPPIDYINANKLSFCEGNVVKYISRYKRKNGLEDLHKCLHYVLLTMFREYNFPKEKITKIMEEVKC